MSGSQRNLLLVAILVVALAFAGVAWWAVRTPAPVAQPPVAIAPPIAAPTQPETPAVDHRLHLDKPVAEEAAATTVVFPLKVELELQASAVRPTGEGVHAMGADATARIAGSVHGGNGEALQAEILFVAGANEGRRFLCDRDGRFGANDLYPGLSVVKISAAGTPGSLREVLLRKGNESQLNVGYGRLATLQGSVKDAVGLPIADARVTIDGQEGRTDEKGDFMIAGLASGETFVVVEKAGYAAHMERLSIVGAQTLEKGRLVYVLRPAARLQVTLEDRLNSDSEAWLYVLPQALDGERDFPWYRVNPVRLFPGGTKVIEDLPAKAVALRLFHAGAIATPPMQSVTLREKETATASLHLAPAPVVNGVVTQDGHPAAGAEVVLEAPEHSGAMLSVLGQSDYYGLEREVIPDFPSAVQRTKATSLGEFVLTANEGVSRNRYLHATSADGKSSAWKLLRGGETRVDLVLERAQGDSELIVRMEGRTQGLPVETKVDGAPRDKQVLAPGRDLHIAGLAPGTWKVTVQWNGAPLVDGMLLDLGKETTLPVTLPEGAIVGQDEDTRKRAQK
ncbi:MAG TPA: carboxypeptidase regulatory-like domain-containing protein [Planctomycetota bacterium]|jgi:hypothetical protein|nr:carboxypeptidase regulatory-like domain-containing protein [Planctomycetota bacterium]